MATRRSVKTALLTAGGIGLAFGTLILLIGVLPAAEHRDSVFASWSSWDWLKAALYLGGVVTAIAFPIAWMASSCWSSR